MKLLIAVLCFATCFPSEARLAAPTGNSSSLVVDELDVQAFRKKMTAERNLAATIFGATADAFVRGGNYANENKGTSSVLMVKDTSNESYVRQSVVKFDLGDTPISSITSATLRLHVAKMGSEAVSFQISVGLGDWEETGVTWNTLNEQWSYVAVAAFSVGLDAADSDSWVEINVLGGILSASHLLQGKPITFLIHSTSRGDSTTWVNFSSRETAEGPQLTIQKEATSWCEEGVLRSSDGLCCSAGCGQCGGSGCSDFPGGASQCCGSQIERQCEDFSDTVCRVPPPAPTPAPVPPPPTPVSWPRAPLMNPDAVPKGMCEAMAGATYERPGQTFLHNVAVEGVVQCEIECMKEPRCRTFALNSVKGGGTCALYSQEHIADGSLVTLRGEDSTYGFCVKITIDMLPHSIVHIQNGDNGGYLSSQQTLGTQAKLKGSTQEWEQWTIEPFDDHYAIKNYHGQYMSVHPVGSIEYRDQKSSWEKFEIERVGSDLGATVSIKSHAHGGYLSFDNQSALRVFANRGAVYGSWEEWLITTEGKPPSPIEDVVEIVGWILVAVSLVSGGLTTYITAGALTSTLSATTTVASVLYLHYTKSIVDILSGIDFTDFAEGVELEYDATAMVTVPVAIAALFS